MTPTIGAPPPDILPPQRGGARPPRLSPPGTDVQLAKGYVTALRKHLKLLIILPAIMGPLVGSLNMLRSRIYRAEAAFVATEQQSSAGTLGALSSVASQLGVPQLSAVASSTASTSAQFYGELLTSTALLHELLSSQFDASAQTPYGGKPFSGTLLDYLRAKGDTPDDKLVDAMKRITRNMLVVSVDRPTGVVRFTVRTKNRALSALVARRLLDLVNEFNLRRRQSQAGAERTFDSRRTQAALDSLHSAEEALADFKAANIDISRSPRLGTREAELQRRVTLAQQLYSTIAQRYEMAAIEAVRNTPVVTVLDSPEGLVEAQPRYTVITAMVAGILGLLIAVAIALKKERVSVASFGSM